MDNCTITQVQQVHTKMKIILISTLHNYTLISIINITIFPIIIQDFIIISIITNSFIISIISVIILNISIFSNITNTILRWRRSTGKRATWSIIKFLSSPVRKQQGKFLQKFIKKKMKT